VWGRDNSEEGTTPMKAPPSDGTVLVVEPDPTTRSCIQECITTSFGTRYQVVSVASRQEAYLQLDRLHPRLLILETDLPDGDGLGLIKHARHQLAPPATVIVCSHRRGVPEKIAALAAGAEDYVVKPLQPERMVLQFQLLERFLALTASPSLRPQ
jgi:DNA-binding response OmpR family regulator